MNPLSAKLQTNIQMCFGLTKAPNIEGVVCIVGAFNPFDGPVCPFRVQLWGLPKHAIDSQIETAKECLILKIHGSGI